MLLTVTWAGGILGAFMDNVVAVPILVPGGGRHGPAVIGAPLRGTLLDYLTLIGSTANSVAQRILER